MDEQKKAEDSVRKAETEQRAAVDELKSQEDKYNKQVSDLEAKSKDANASTVSKNKAAAELAQLKQEDPLPLRKAKISQGKQNFTLSDSQSHSNYRSNFLTHIFRSNFA